MSDTARLVTADELERFPRDDRRYELVAGRIVRMTPVGYPHGRIAAQFAALLRHHVGEPRLGVVFVELGVVLSSNPDTVRAPDVAFISQDRIPAVEPRGFWHGAPDLAVEVLSPQDAPSEVRSKVDEYLAHGVAAVVILDPARKMVEVVRRASSQRLTRPDERLELDDVVPGFRCSVSAIFE